MRGIERSSARVYGCFGAWKIASTGACSTTRPRYITTTSSAISATTPRSWVISMIAMPSSLLELAHQVEDLRLGGHVERGGRLVGDQQRRVAGERHRDHRPLAQAAAQLVWRSSSTRSLRRGTPDPPQQSRSPARAPPRACRAGWWSRIASMIWLPTVWTGLNEVIGSWKTSAISPPRIARISRAVRRRAAPGRPSSPRPAAAGRPPEVGSRRSTIRPGRSTMRRIERAVTLLPQPLSPTMPSVRPACRSKLDAVDRLDGPLVLRRSRSSDRGRRGSASTPSSRRATVGVAGCP